jgi:hypothetical protein
VKRLALTLLAAGCARTEVQVVVTNQDLKVPTDLATLVIQAFNPLDDPSLATPIYPSPPIAPCAPGQSSGCEARPISVTLYQGSKHPDEPVRVEVDGRDANGNPVLSLASVFRFASGQSDRLEFQLYQACLHQFVRREQPVLQRVRLVHARRANGARRRH